MTTNELAIGTKIRNIGASETFTIVRLPNSRKKSIGVTEDGGSDMEKWVYVNELPGMEVVA
jgi:hypothetical protein